MRDCLRYINQEHKLDGNGLKKESLKFLGIKVRNFLMRREKRLLLGLEDIGRECIRNLDLMPGYKINIHKYDDERVIVSDSYGLDEDTINAINNFCLKEEIRDLYFATLDDGTIGLVCKPKTFL